MLQRKFARSIAPTVVELVGRPNATLASAQSHNNRRSNTQHCDNADINLVSASFKSFY